MKYRRYDRDGNEIEDDDDFLRDGERLTVSVMFTDAARFQEIKAACDERNAMRNAEERHIADARRKLEAEREAYQRRVSDAWRGPPPADHERHEDGFDDSPEIQRERYIERITNAWRAGP